MSYRRHLPRALVLLAALALAWAILGPAGPPSPPVPYLGSDDGWGAWDADERARLLLEREAFERERPPG